MFSFVLGYPRSAAANSQSAVLFNRMLHAHPTLAPYLQNTSNLSLAEYWMANTIGLGMPEAYDLDMPVLLRLKGQIGIDDSLVSISRRSATWAYCISKSLDGPDIPLLEDPSYYSPRIASDNEKFMMRFNFAVRAIARVGGDLDAGGTFGFWMGHFSDSVALRLGALLEACPAEVSPVVFCEAVNEYGLDGAVALHRDGVPIEYLQAAMA